jgi:hypothetical protein
MGPRIDGEQVVDISSPDDPLVCASLDNDPDFYGAYSRFGGTSGATPHVAGVSALMLGSGLFQTHAEIERALTTHALVDDATGEVPNEAYGFGKIRSAQAIFGESIPHNNPPTTRISAARDELCNLVLTAAPTDADADAVTITWDIWYNGIIDPTPGLSLILPKTEVDIPVVIHARDAHGTTSRSLQVVSSSDYPCTIAPVETGGCSGLSTSQDSVFILLLMSVFLFRAREHSLR